MLRNKQNIQKAAAIKSQILINTNIYVILAFILCVSAILFAFAEPSFAADPFSGLGNKIQEAQSSLVNIGKYIIAFILAVMCLLAIIGKVNWAWVGYVFAGAVGLFMINEIVGWLTTAGK